MRKAASAHHDHSSIIGNGSAERGGRERRPLGRKGHGSNGRRGEAFPENERASDQVHADIMSSGPGTCLLHPRHRGKSDAINAAGGCPVELASTKGEKDPSYPAHWPTTNRLSE